MKEGIVERRNPKTGIWEKVTEVASAFTKVPVLPLDGTTTSATTTKVKTCTNASVVSSGKFKRDNEVRVCRTFTFER